MKTKKSFPGAFFAILFSVLLLSACKDDIELLREKFTIELLSGQVNEERVRELVSAIREDGTWPGIDYIDTSRIAFQHTEHLDNMLVMARALRKEDSPFRNHKELKSALLRALDFWLANDFTCENWWNNQIGTPNTMVALLLILDKNLSKEQTEKMLKIAGRANLNASGARPSGDRIKIAGILAKAALFSRDKRLVEEVLNLPPMKSSN
jgi:chondroitin AC lyase